MKKQKKLSIRDKAKSFFSASPLERSFLNNTEEVPRHWSLRVLFLLIDFLVIFACVLPFAYAVGGFYAVSIVVFITVICTLHALMRSHADNIILGLTSGFIISLIIWALFATHTAYWGTVEEVFLFSFTGSFIIGMLPETIEMLFPQRTVFSSAHMTFGIICVGLFALAAALFALFMKMYGHDAMLFESAIVRGIIYGVCLGTLYSLLIRFILLPSLNVFKVLFSYIRAMLKPMMLFFIGYLILTFTFAGLYALIGTMHHGAFVGASIPLQFNEYLYFSFTIISTLGTADIVAHSLIVKWISIVEVMLGLMWVTIVLAATIGYLEEAFATLSKKYKGHHKA